MTRFVKTRHTAWDVPSGVVNVLMGRHATTSTVPVSMDAVKECKDTSVRKNAIVGTLVKTVKTNATSTVRWAVDVIRQQGNVKGAV